MASIGLAAVNRNSTLTLIFLELKVISLLTVISIGQKVNFTYNFKIDVDKMFVQNEFRKKNFNAFIAKLFV